MMGRLKESKWVYVLLSILIAFFFWLYVRAEQDPVQPTWLPNVTVVQTGNSVLTRQGLTVSELSQETVNLRIEAPTSVLEGLRRNRKDITVTIDVSRCEAGENKLTYTPNWPANVNKDNIVVLDREPDTITVTVDKLYTSIYNIEFQLHGSVAKGYQAGTPGINPETVIVSGSVEQVSQVAKVVAILEDENLSQRFAGDLPLVLLDAKGEVLTDLEVTLDSTSAYVVLPVVVVKEVPLTVNFVYGGGVISEKEFSYDIEPKTILVSGAEEDLKDLTEISLGSVELAKVIGSGTITRTIDLDPSLENVSGVTSATITVTINGLSTRSIDVNNIVLSNKPEGYQIISATQMKTVVIRGPEADLAAIDASQLRIVADMSQVTTVGTYTVPVKVYLDAGNTVGVIGEYSIVVDISK